MDGNDNSGDMSAALALFDRAEANLGKLEQVWREIEARVPDNLVFGDDPEVDQLIRDFEALAASLPAIDGKRLTERPMGLNEIAQSRFDALEVGEIEIRMSVENEILMPGRAVGEYRSAFDRTRRSLIRDEIDRVVAAMDALLRGIGLDNGVATWVGADRWDELTSTVAELDRLAGTLVPGNARWGDLHRHIHFAQSNDLWDIATMDWPSVKCEVESNLYGDREPMPVAIDDLTQLVRARPRGPVSTEIDWTKLAGSEFERLIFEIVRQTDGYENVDWLMDTNARTAVEMSKPIMSRMILSLARAVPGLSSSVSIGCHGRSEGATSSSVPNLFDSGSHR